MVPARAGEAPGPSWAGCLVLPGSGDARRRVQRPEFHVLALVEAGAGRHRADFTDYPLGPGSIVWIRPGVVHQWTDVDRLRGALVLFTHAAVGVGAKKLLDERLALEAKRLLAHTQLTVAGCARRLGFDDPANFTTFFQRNVGMAPGAWRAAERGD